MKSTSADDVIIQALWPGPGDDSVFGVPLVTYASRSATRAASSALETGTAGGAWARAGWATKRPTRMAAEITATSRGMRRALVQRSRKCMAERAWVFRRRACVQRDDHPATHS